MLLSWPLEESAHVPDGVRQVWPGVDEVPQTPNDEAVQCRVHFLRCAITTQPEPLLHRRCCSLAVRHACHHQDLGIMRLPQCDAFCILAHLDAKIEGQQSEIAHQECPLHLLLELFHYCQG
jgi:hypothetical protein